MLFMLCCCSEAVCNKITFNVKGCNSLALEDAHVEVCIGGTVYSSGDTDASGVFETADLASGTYSYTISKTRFSDATGTVTIACPDSDKVVNRTLAPDADHVCGYCADPHPKTLYWTDSSGTTTLTWDGTTWNNQSAASSTVAAGCTVLGLTDCATSPATSSVAYNIHVSLHATDILSVTLGASAIQCAGPTYYYVPAACVGFPTYIFQGGATKTSGGCPVPVTTTYSLPSNWTKIADTPTLAGVVTGTGTLTE